MREARLPSFYTMTFKEQVIQLLENGLQERPHLFVVDLKVTDKNDILVTLDGDVGVNLQDCIFISRAIEHNLDKETIDFGLEVSSAGATSPLRFARQYYKNIGRTLKVVTPQITYEAVLAAANEAEIRLEWSTREPKKIGKGKETIQHHINLTYDQITDAKVIVAF